MVTASPFETGGISPEEIKRIEKHAAAVAQEQINRGASPDAIVETGYVEMPEKNEVVLLTREEIEQTDVAIMSGEILVSRETEKVPVKKATKPAKQPKLRPTPPARTAKQKMAKDSRPDLKPFPYGTRED